MRSEVPHDRSSYRLIWKKKALAASYLKEPSDWALGSAKLSNKTSRSMLTAYAALQATLKHELVDASDVISEFIPLALHQTTSSCETSRQSYRTTVPSIKTDNIFYTR